MSCNPGTLALSAFLTLCLLAPSPGWAGNSEEIIQNLKDLRFDKLGNPQIKSDAIQPLLSSKERPHKLLIIPVQYSNRKFDRFSEESNADRKNQQYFDRLLFSNNLGNPAKETLTHYYYHQSKGRYYVTGKVFPLVTVDQPSEYYGKPVQNSDGQWRNDSGAETLVEDTLRAAYKQEPDFPWNDYDVWDPADYDGDGNRDEPDGYIDHFVLVFAGKGQASCQSLFSLDEKFTANAAADLYDTLQSVEQECAQRIWPHRFSLTKNNGKGPEVEGFVNRRGGVELKKGLWVYDYNMQSEYTNISTFIHEFGHSIGLPDIYARQTSNSTASWEVMSATVGPVPQEMSAWSRLMLGWLEPCVISPRSAGGSKVQSVYLKTMNDWSTRAGGRNEDGVCDAAMVLLPPKIRKLEMGPLEAHHKKQAAYTGQGNDMNHYLSRSFDLAAIDGPIILEFDTWFEIEADWDYLYVEASTDGENYQRLLPVDKVGMPAKNGHDGAGTIPGFTGRSGDLDGDGKVESAIGCDPSRDVVSAEDSVGQSTVDPCQAPQWLHVKFDLQAFRGQEVEIRFHYFADGAAVEDGALLDNVEIKALDYLDEFEQENFQGWRVDGYSLSGGSHELAMPQFYLLEYRDPYETFDKAHNYDQNLNRPPGFTFFRDLKSGEMKALDVRYRPGVLVWYYNGSYLWSQNEPAQFGPGNGFLLLVDSNPQEFKYPGVLEQYYKNDKDRTYYEFEDDAQSFLQKSFLDVMCFQRREDYFPVDLTQKERDSCTQSGALPEVEGLRFEDKTLIYGYTLGNEFLPGKDREAYKGVSSLFQNRVRNGVVSYRLYDRRLRNFHSADAPFSLKEFEGGLQYYRIENGEMVEDYAVGFSKSPSFSDSDPSRYLNAHLPFGSANIPTAGLQFDLVEPNDNAPETAKVKVYFQWER